MGNLREDILQTVDPDIFKKPELLPTPTVGDKGGPSARSGAGFGPPLGQVAVQVSNGESTSQPSGNGNNGWGE